MKHFIVLFLVSCSALASKTKAKTKDFSSTPPLSFAEDADGNVILPGASAGGSDEDDPSISSYLPEVPPGDTSSNSAGSGEDQEPGPEASFALTADPAPDASPHEESPPTQPVAQQPAPASGEAQGPQTVQLIQEPSLTFRPSPGQSPKATELQSPANNALGLNAVARHRHHSWKPNPRAIRPKAGTGNPDVVSLGMFGKVFYGTNLKNNKFDLDVIMVLKWTDKRVTDMVPAGLDRVTLSGKQAMEKVWMPEVVITNRDIRKWEIISTVVMIYKTGEVTKVERSIVSCNNIFLLADYPFDTQQLQVKVASAKYMLSELVLKVDEDKSISGVNPTIFDAFQYELNGFKVFTFEEKDGAMQKSRGVLEISARRTMDKYAESHLMPTFLLLAISWGVFWFPFQNPFITPRMALSILALIAFTNLMIKSNEALPGGAPCNWNDVFNQTILTLMCSTICLNIISEIFKHHMGLTDLAQTINHEAKVVQPILSLTVIVVVLTGGKYKWISIGIAQVLAKLLFMAGFFSYVAFAFSRMSVHKAEKERKDAEAKEKERLAAEAKGFMMPPQGP